jgi:hypothetical protein
MKKIFFLASIMACVYACNNDKTETTTIQTDTTTNTASAPSAYTPSEGDVTYRNTKVMVWRNNEWEETNEDVKLDNGVVVRSNGRVIKDRDTVVLDDGEVVDKSGRFFDKAGNVIEDAWDATKEGAKDAGKAVKKGANKVGEEVKDVFKDDKKDSNQ